MLNKKQVLDFKKKKNKKNKRKAIENVTLKLKNEVTMESLINQKFCIYSFMCYSYLLRFCKR